MRTIIAGSRHFTEEWHYDELKDLIEYAEREHGIIPTVVLSGKAPGVDTLGEQWARENGIPVDPYPAEWENLDALGARVKKRADGTEYNARAGTDRNITMAYNADALIILWNGSSPGSRHMLSFAKHMKLWFCEGVIR